MGTVQIQFKTIEQLKALIMLLRKLKIEFQIVDSSEFVDEVADINLNDAYQASIPVLADDWDDSENDHWDSL